MAKLSSNAVRNALLCSWDSVRATPSDQIEWDISILPLLFGPLSVLDNMIFDSRGLVLAMQKPAIRELLRGYVKDGLIQLWHRPAYGPENERAPVQHAEDVLMDWLTRSGDALGTVALYSVGELGCKELRDLVGSFPRGMPRTDRLRKFYAFMETYIPGYGEAVAFFDDLFFTGLNTNRWENNPAEHLQYRVLEAMGLADPEAAVRSSLDRGKPLYQVIDNECPVKLGCPADNLDWMELVHGAYRDGSEREFFRRLTTTGDPTRLGLLEPAGSIALEKGAYSSHLCGLINAAFVCGIPETNSQDVLWPWPGRFTPSEDVAPIERFIGPIDPERVQTMLYEHPDLIENAKHFGDYLQGKPGRKTLAKHINRLQDLLFQAQIVKQSSWAAPLTTFGGAYALQFVAQSVTCPESIGWLKEMGGCLAMYGVHFPTALAAAKYLRKPVERVWGFVYAKVLGRENMYGKHGGDFYKRAKHLVDVYQLEPFGKHQ